MITNNPNEYYRYTDHYPYEGWFTSSSGSITYTTYVEPILFSGASIRYADTEPWPVKCEKEIEADDEALGKYMREVLGMERE